MAAARRRLAIPIPRRSGNLPRPRARESPRTASCSGQPVIDLNATYERLTRPWTHEQLAKRYEAANHRRERRPEDPQDDVLCGPIAILATAIPPAASLSVAIHVLHVLPATSDPRLVDQLLGNVGEHSAVVLHRCHRALDLDGQAHGYTADEWLPAVYDIAASLLEGARLNREPPSLVEQVQDAVSWLSRAIIDLDQDAPDAGAAIVDALGRILALHVFADVRADSRPN
jgi:hypothetical protein